MSQERKKRNNASRRGGKGKKHPVAQSTAPQSVKQTAAAVKERTAEEQPRPERERPERQPRPEREQSAPRPRERGGQSGRETSPAMGAYLAFEHEMTRIRRRWRHLLRENRAHRFPESERLPIQLLLLFWGMMPMALSRLEERVLGRRKRSARRGRLFGAWHPSRLIAVGLMALLCLVGAVAAYRAAITKGVVVTYDGELLGAVSTEKEVETARRNLEQVTSRTLGTTYTIDDSLIHYSVETLKEQEMMDESALEAALFRKIGLVTDAYCLYVDGERIGATPYEGALEQLLKQLKLAATNEGTISCEFAETVEIKEEHVPTAEIMNLGYLAETLYSTKSAEVTYEVKKGDTWSQIANSHGMTSKELLALNPGYNIDKLQIGEVLTLSASVPYLTMTVVQQERYVEATNFDIEYTDAPDMWRGDEEVTSKGEFGASDVVANVTYVNGEETERTLLSSVLLRQPVTEHRLRGTKERPTWYPTGSFRWPVSGRLTSYFGGRRSPGGIGSTNHKGIDIAAPRGTPVYAADGGTVTYAGWMGGYGYLVQINHGNGMVTYYGHNSSLTVSVGDHVYKGQQIARVGSTGNSTGNHCHFEVRVNGVARNPLNYLR